jgi:hypothetical protein
MWKTGRPNYNKPLISRSQLGNQDFGVLLGIVIGFFASTEGTALQTAVSSLRWILFWISFVLSLGKGEREIVHRRPYLNRPNITMAVSPC